MSNQNVPTVGDISFMGQRLLGQVALVTGAGRGIGRSIAELFVHHGATVVLVDRDSELLNAAESAITAGLCWTKQCDVADSSEVEHLFEQVIARHGALDILVNVAGIAGGGRPLLDIDDATWQRMLDVNLSGSFYCCRAAVRAMLSAQRPGRIISISSTGALSGESAVHYDASKGALLAMTRSMARELGGRGIRVNAICPGPINTELLKGLKSHRIEQLVKRIPLQRIGETGDIATAALFLASKESDFVTGQTLMVNGGSWFL